MPVNPLFTRTDAVVLVYGDYFKVECPTGSGTYKLF